MQCGFVQSTRYIEIKLKPARAQPHFKSWGVPNRAKPESKAKPEKERRGGLASPFPDFVWEFLNFKLFNLVYN